MIASTFLHTRSQKWSFPMSAPAFDHETNPNLKKIQVEQTIPSKEELKGQIDQLNKEDYRGFKALSFEIIIAIAIWIIIFAAIWLAWL